MEIENIEKNIEQQITPKHLLWAVIAVCACLVLHAYISTQNNLAKVDQVRQDIAPVHKEAAEEKKSAVIAEDTNQKLLAKALDTIAKQKEQPVTTQVDYDRIAAMIESRMGSKAKVFTDTNTPDAPSATVSAVKLRDYMSDCDATTLELNSCRKTANNFKAQYEAEVKDHDATKQELKVTKTALKGGSFFHRLKGNSKWLLIGAAAGAVIAKH